MPDRLKMKPGPKSKPFWSLVNMGAESGCWEWGGSRFGNGYGRAFKDCTSVGAHRLAYELASGQSIPPSMFVCHRCDNKICVRPSHLFLGSPADNLRDMVEKGRSLRGSLNRQARLNEEAAREIRRAYAEGDVTQRQLGIEYGVSDHAIWKVVNGRGWQHA